MLEQLMQPRPLVGRDAVGEDVEVELPRSTYRREQNLGEAGSVRLHAGIAAIPIDRRGTGRKSGRWKATGEPAAPTSPAPG
jgi:hypothetical protein